MSRVRAWHLQAMGERLADATHDRVCALLLDGGLDSSEYLRARASCRRRRKALARLTAVLARLEAERPAGAR